MAQDLNELYDYALSFFGTPYEWGGGHWGHKGYGLDCSGYLNQLLSYGSSTGQGDNTAQGYYDLFLKTPCQPTLGALSFFGKNSIIHHVGFTIDSKVMISAAGGGPHITSIELARAADAKIKIEPLTLRSDYAGSFWPRYRYGG